MRETSELVPCRTDVCQNSREISCFRQFEYTMASDQCELDSFYRKFLGLRKFGRNATLRMESGPDGRCLVNLQLELPTRSKLGQGYDVPVVVSGGEAHVPVHGGDAPVQDKQRVEH